MAVVETMTCNSCGKVKKQSDFYSSHSPFNKATGRIPICKTCIWDYVEPMDFNDYDRQMVLNALRMIDRPYLKDLWEATIEECSGTTKKAFGVYMKNLGMVQNRELTWDDSDLKENVIDVTGQDGEVLQFNYKEAANQFGKGYSKEEYDWLMREYIDWTNRYECDTKAMETMITEICTVSLEIKKRRASNDKVDSQLKTLQDLLGSSNLKPVQESGALANVESFGTLIKKYENEHPIPEPSPEFKDVDKISSYIRVFFTGHLMRMLGKKDPDLEKEYWEAMDELTVLKEEQEDEDDDLV